MARDLVHGPFMITGQGRYFSAALIDKNTPKTDPQEAGYLTDKDPEFASGGAGFGVADTNPIYFPTLGRMYRVGVRMQF